MKYFKYIFNFFTGDPYLATFQQRMTSQSNDKHDMMTSHCTMTSQAIEMLELFHSQTSKMEGKQCEKFSINYKNAVNNRFVILKIFEKKCKQIILQI